jgi:uncharacterized membrane protein
MNVPGAAATQAFGIDSPGQIVGFYFDAAGTPHGFLRDKGGFNTIDVPGALETFAFGINPAGQIVGLYEKADGTFHGFVAQ